MPQYRYSASPYRFGPGPISPGIKMLIKLNILAFVATIVWPRLVLSFGLTPQAVFEQFHFWQPVTYLFLHGGLFHILFNMLALWMFGVELERLWGSKAFIKYYFVTGIGAAVTMLFVSLLPIASADQMYSSLTIGASGAVYAVLLANALCYPERTVFLYGLFPMKAKYFIMIIGGTVFLSSINDANSGVAHIAHLGGLLVGYLYLRGGGGGTTNLIGEIKYQYIKWKMNRLRRRFHVHPGKRDDDWTGPVH